MVEDDRVKDVTVVVRPMQYLLARGAGDQGTEKELENLPEEGILGLELDINDQDSLGRLFDNGVIVDHARIKLVVEERKKVLVVKGMALDWELVLSSVEGEKVAGIVLGTGDINATVKKVDTVVPPVDLNSSDIAWDSITKYFTLCQAPEFSVRATLFDGLCLKHQSLFAEAATSYIRMINELSDLRSVKLLKQVRILG